LIVTDLALLVESRLLAADPTYAPLVALGFIPPAKLAGWLCPPVSVMLPVTVPDSLLPPADSESYFPASEVPEAESSRRKATANL